MLEIAFIALQRLVDDARSYVDAAERTRRAANSKQGCALSEGAELSASVENNLESSNPPGLVLVEERAQSRKKQTMDPQVDILAQDIEVKTGESKIKRFPNNPYLGNPKPLNLDKEPPKLLNKKY